MKRLKKIILWLLGSILLIALLIFIAFQLSPRPGAFIIGHLFNGEIQITDKDYYDTARKEIALISDKKYQATFKENTYDIYYPKDTAKPVPVLIWAHGGGYVGGDKEGTKEFATRIAADAKIAVVSLNYEVAPSSQYPNQVLQLGQLVKDLQQEKHPMIDLSNIFFGGDSAGAQIALQYVATQTNPDYGKAVGIRQIVPKENIQGAISYCGPVDLKQMATQKTDSRFMKFFVKTVAWSLIGTKEWQKDQKLFQASVVEHVNADFPPTYITDGNAYSFEDQGISLENRLKTLKVPVTGLFYKDVKKEITHEYQFNYDTNEAKTCYQQTLDFLLQNKS